MKAQNATPTPGKSYAEAASVQTSSCSTQTEPIAALPPLKLLTPLTTSNTATNTTQESMVEDGDEPTSSPDTQDDSSMSPVVAQKPMAPPETATHSRSREWTKVTKTKGPRPQPSPSPARAGPSVDRPSRPPVRVSMGRSRSSSWASPSREQPPPHSSS